MMSYIALGVIITVMLVTFIRAEIKDARHAKLYDEEF